MGSKLLEATREEIPLLNTSSTMQNSIRDRGSPWRTPLLHWRYPQSKPLTARDNLADSIILFIQPQKVEQKPKLLRTLSRNFHSKVSKAFLTSNLMPKFPPYTLQLSILTASKVIQTQSKMLLPWIKPLWLLETILGAILESLPARTLLIILNWKFAITIGLYCPIKRVEGILGKRATMFEFNPCKILEKELEMPA